ncbi:MAG: hypothetical protein R2939_09075 [Kofleriaceae bacterium]
MRRLVLSLSLLLATLGGGLGRAAAAPPAPTGAHPRLFLTPELRGRWQALAKAGDNPVAASVRWCADVRARPAEFAREGYQALDWAKHLQACLVAWAATGDDAHARTAMVYFTAMLDDLTVVGDGQGGDEAARRDSGFAIRSMGPYTALAYDWLHDHPAMNEDLRATARRRFHAWTGWYLTDGYRARSAGTNYQAGYLVAATVMAIAEGGEGGAPGDALWRHVVDTLWGQDMAPALAPGGLLEGGDWGEGWQYGPLSVAEYALAARALAEQGVPVPGMATFLTGVFTRHVHALAPGGGVFVGGDTEDERANIAPSVNTLAAVALGDAPPIVRGWALGELTRLGLVGAGARLPEFPLLAALAVGRAEPPVAPPRESWPTWYLAPGTGNLYARATWADDSVWTVMQCTSTLDIDHFHADAGNVVVSRGADDLLVDPSPYGTLSTLTSNAPTVASAHLPAEYIPGQAYWSQHTRWDWAHQSRRGVVTGRCDYADQYRFQHRPSDVPAALRDLVLVPWAGGADATLVVVDRAVSGAASRPLYTRFRMPGTVALDGDVARAKVGASRIEVQRLASSSGQLAQAASTAKDCWTPPRPRGDCNAARLPVGEARLTVDGPRMSAVQVVDVAAAGAVGATSTSVSGPGWSGAWLERDGGAAMIVWGAEPPWQAPTSATTLTYTAPARAGAVHVVLDAPGAAERVAVTSRRVGDACEVTLTVGGAVAARPAHLLLDEACAVEVDPILVGAGAIVADPGALGAGSAIAPDVVHGTVGRPAAAGRSPRSGCCGAQASPAQSVGGMLLVSLVVLRRRRRRD